MRAMINKIKETRKNEDGAAMMTAILFMVIMMMVVTVITVTSLAGIAKQQGTQEEAGFFLTNENAISNAVALANNPLPTDSINNHIGIANAVYGESDPSETETGDGFYKWLWYVEPVTDNITGSGYDLIAISYNEDPYEEGSRTSVVRLQPIKVTDARYLSDGSIGYAPIPTGNFVWGLFAANGMTLEDGVVVRSFDSSVKVKPTSVDDTGVGSVASNANFVLNTTDPTTVKRIVAFQAGVDNDTSGRCITEANCNGKVVPYSYGVDTVGFQNKVNEVCPLAATSYPNYVSSLNTGRINNNTQGQCFNNVVFDANTEVETNHNASTPAMMYIKGNITVRPTIKVNQSELRGGPLALRIYSSDGTNATFQGGTAANRTAISALIGGYRLNCVDQVTAEKSLVIIGGLSCNTVHLHNGTTFYWDQNTWTAYNNDTTPNKGAVWTPIRSQ